MSGQPDTTLALADPNADEVIGNALTVLGSPGSFFNGPERLAIAAHARGVRGLAAPTTNLPPVIEEATARVAVKAMASRSEHIAAWEGAGWDVLAYVELVSVVAQICSIDSYRIGLGAELDPLPEPVDGEPVLVADEEATRSNAWVPTVGQALAPTALSALPNEKASKAALGAVWYLTDDLIHKYDTEPDRELTRPQMELVASRTSWLNECFF
jgi:hypothetical protein